jgi:hypothetical protein
MRVRFLCMSAVLVLLLPASVRVLGHHSFAAEYLASEETWTGTVTKLLFRTPHVHFFLDVKDKSGKVTNWTFELTTPEQILRRGLTRSSIKIGDELTIVGYPAKDNQPMAMTRTISSPQGQLMYVWDYEDFGPTKSDRVVVSPTGERLEP